MAQSICLYPARIAVSTYPPLSDKPSICFAAALLYDTYSLLDLVRLREPGPEPDLGDLRPSGERDGLSERHFRCSEGM